jgi:DNA polymerase-4
MEALTPLAERVERSLIRHQMAASGVVIKLKTQDFRLQTRHHRLPTPSQKAAVLLAAAEPLVRRLADGRLFRLVGIGAEPLVGEEKADPPDLFTGLG